jgi:hypothetical protein
MPAGEDTQGPQLELIDWLATADRPVPPALAAEAAAARAAAPERTPPDDD